MFSRFPDDVLFESFTFPFFDFGYQADHARLASAFMDLPDPNPKVGKRGLYVHIPFCDTICEMCPFIKSVGTQGRIETYLKSLLLDVDRTAATPRARSWEIDAVYIGGGTPSVLGPENSAKLIFAIRRAFNLRTDVEITFEVEAKSATDELLHAVAGAGATRISFGIQSLDPTLRDIINLTATREQIETTIETGKLLFDDVNADMIVGFPGQTHASAMRDLEDAASLGASTMSLYPMDYVTVLPKLLNKMRFGEVPRPVSHQERWDMFFDGRDVLKSVYKEQNMYCFGSEGLKASEYMFHILYGGYHDQYIGVGASSYTSLSGVLFHNQVSEEEFVQAALQGRSVVQRASFGHGYEKDLVFFPKRLSTDLSLSESLGLSRFAAPRIRELVERGWAEMSGSSLCLTELGKRQYYRVMVGFLMDDQRRIYDGACSRLSTSLGLSPSGDLLEGKATAKGMGTAISLNAGKTRGLMKKDA